MDNGQQFQHSEARLDHDLHAGNQIHAAASLLHEFEHKPHEALALIKHEMKKNSHCDKNSIGIEANGDVFIWNKEHNSGVYAGNIPASRRGEFLPPAQKAPVEAPAPRPVVEAPPAALPPPPPEQATAPGPQSYEYQEPHHRGFHIPFPIDIGVHNGSLHVGVNVLGLVKGGVMLGEKNRGYVGSDALQTEVSAGVDLNKNHIGPAGDWRVLNGAITEGRARVGITPHHDGINIGAGADASAFGHNIGAGGAAGLEAGQKLGPHADGYAYVGKAEADASGSANLSDQGLQARANVNAGAEPYVGAHVGARAGLGAKNEAHADAGVNVGDNGVSAGAGVYPQFHPDVYVRGHAGDSESGVGLIPLRAWHRDSDED